MKKRIALTLSVLMLFSLILGSAATTADEKPTQKEYKGITVEQEAEARTWFTEEELRLLEESETSIDKMYNQGDANILYKELQVVLGPEKHGGMYIDDNGNLVILYIPEHEQTVREAAERDKQREDQFYTLLPAKYSYKELEDAIVALLRLPDELRLALCSFGIDQSTNRVVLGISESWFNEDTFNGIRGYFKSDYFTFVKSPDFPVLEDCASYTIPIGGGASNSGGSFTLACGVKWTHNGTTKYGFLTAGHCAISNYVFYYGAQVGYVVKAQNSGSIDAAVVERNTPFDTFIASKFFINGFSVTNNTSFLAGGWAQNSTIYIYGSSSGVKQTTIRFTNRPIMNSDKTVILFTNMVEMNTTVLPGDSGGPIRYTQNGTTFVAGVVKGNYNGNGGNFGYYSDANQIKTIFGISGHFD